MCSFLKKDFFIIERGEGREKGRERNIDQLLLTCAPAGDQAHNSGMCPTGNQTGNVSLCRTTPNQLSYVGQGLVCSFLSDFSKFFPTVELV